jgi:Flp pilus assembly protein TadD
MAFNNLGVLEVGEHRLEAAEGHFRRALALKEDYAEARVNLGNLLLLEGEIGEAVVELEGALAVDPGSVEAHTNLGVARMAGGDPRAAAASFRAALWHAPGLARAREGLAGSLLMLGEAGQAILQYRLAVDLDPRSAVAHHGLGYALSESGELADGIDHLERAARLRPGWAAPLRRIAWLLATRPCLAGRENEALRLAARANELDGDRNPETLDVLAAAHAAAGSFERAVEVAWRARTLAAPDRRPAIDGRIELYRRGRPYRTEEGCGGE